MTVAVYAGSFDPITDGHLDIIVRASCVFEKVIVGIGTNSAKTGLFIPGDREIMVKEECKSLSNVEVQIFTGLLVNFCKKVEAQVIIRGLRAVTELESEMGIAHVNSQLDSNIDTFFLVSKPQYSFVSSSTVKEIARLGGDISYYVSPFVAAKLQSRIHG